MPHETRDKRIAPAQERASSGRKAAFPGFAPPVSNTTYTPNQFFDVCIPNASRGCVRIVAYLIRRTLGWCDAEGNPQQEQIEVSYAEFISRAGVSRDMIRQALDEAVSGNFIVRVREGRRSVAGDHGERALFSLRWDSGADYIRQPQEFRGFFEGEGNRTDIPNEFFDRLIPGENLSVVKVVGCVIRYSIGFQARRGMRRQQAPLAYSQILKAGGLSSRRTLAASIQEAVSKGYIVRVHDGYFSPKVSERRSAIYAVRWMDNWQPGNPSAPTSRKRIPAESGITQSEKDTSTGQKRIPADRSEKDTIGIKQLNKKQKQQIEAASLLKKEGFDGRTATKLAAEYGLEAITRQIQWLPQRHATRNPQGLLRRAIEGNWPTPPGKSKAEAGSVRPALPLPAGYRKFLKGESQFLARTSPEEQARFEAKRQRLRADLKAERSAALRAQLLAGHDSETGRLMDFQTFFGLPGVQEWARDINNQSNQSQK